MADPGGLTGSDSIGLTVTPAPGMVPIVNPSFEDQVVADGGWSLAIPGWTQTGATGTFNPTPAQFPAGAPEGDNVAYLNAILALLEGQGEALQRFVPGT